MFDVCGYVAAPAFAKDFDYECGFFFFAYWAIHCGGSEIFVNAFLTSGIAHLAQTGSFVSITLNFAGAPHLQVDC